MKTFKNKGKIVKKHTTNNWFQPQTIIKPPLLYVLISSVVQFDKNFYLMVLYGNYHICIFMNINENLINEGKLLHKLELQGIIRHIST